MKDKIDEFYDKHRVLAPTVSGIAGYKMMADPKALSRFTGTEHLFHGARVENVPSIFDKGLLVSKSFDPNTISHQYGLQDVAKGYVFTGRTMKPVRQMNVIQEFTRKHGWEAASKASALTQLGKLLFGRTPSMKTLDVRIPYEDLKKLKPVADPGWVRQMDALNKSKASPMLKRMAKWMSRPFSPDHTYAFAHDIAPEYIKGSSKFSHGLLAELKGMPKYIMNNPGRFLRGAGKLGAGAGLLGLTAHQIMRGFKGKKGGNPGMIDRIRAIIEKKD